MDTFASAYWRLFFEKIFNRTLYALSSSIVIIYGDLNK